MNKVFEQAFKNALAAGRREAFAYAMLENRLPIEMVSTPEFSKAIIKSVSRKAKSKEEAKERIENITELIAMGVPEQKILRIEEAFTVMKSTSSWRKP